jgi:hypothetical protein
MAAESQERKTEQTADLTREHALVHPGEVYTAFWDQHAAQSESPAVPVLSKILAPESRLISRQQLREVG